MASPVQICNLALVGLGKKTITSLSQNTTNAERCNDIYDEVRKMVIQSHPWNGCTAQQELNQLASTPPFKWTYKYTLPSDCLRPLTSNQDLGSKRLWQQVGQEIWTNHGTFILEYIFDNEDTTTYSQGLVMAIAARLEAELAYPLTGSVSLAEKKLAVYTEIKLPEAKALDAQVGQAQIPDDDYDPWQQARYDG